MARAEGLNVLSASILSDRKRPLATAAALARSAGILQDHIRQSGADVVLLTMNFAVASALAFTCQKKLVYFAHDPAPHPGDYTPGLQRITQNFLLRRADAIVGLSEYATKILGGMAPQGKLHLAPLSGVYEPDSKPRGALAQGPTRLLFVGRLVRYKGFDVLAEALGKIAHRQDWRLTIAGAGPEAERAAGLFANIPQVAPVRAGWLAEEALLSLQREHDILLSPYISATQSGTISDSLALAAPVVATPVGALPEQVGGGGWIAESITGEGFAAALTRALDERAAYGEKSAAALAQARSGWTAGWHWLEQL
jgi:glycosyltransferase involved in cell wall biosynthesis